MDEAIPLIHNPAARSEKSARLSMMLSRLDPAPRILPTDGPGSARRLAFECARRGEKVVVAGGGDGTVNEVVAGLLDAAATGLPVPELGLMPLGTMNVFALEMGMPVRNVRHCWKFIVEGHTREVDVWLGNGHPMIQLGGVGLDAAVVTETTWEMKRRMGPLSYLVNAARVLSRPAPNLVIDVDGQTIEGALVLFGNGQRYGGPLKVFPDAVPDDGLLDVLILRKQTAGDVLGFLAALATGTLSKFPGVWLGKGCRIGVRCTRDVPVELDGEPIGWTPFDLKPLDFRLHVRVPAVK